LKAHKYVAPHVSRLSLLLEYLLRFLILHFMRWEVCWRKQCFLVILLTIDCDKTHRVAIWPLEQDLLPILLKASTMFLTICWIVSKLLNVSMPKILLTTFKLLYFNKAKNTWHLATSYFGSKYSLIILYEW
jgi:hypothetical protein